MSKEGNYAIVIYEDPQIVANEVSRLLAIGFKLHGDLRITPKGGFVQALWRDEFARKCYEEQKP